MKCPNCEQEHPDYEFYSPRGKATPATRWFFVNGWKNMTCWECNGPYRCLGCGEIKAPSQFRVGGRFCQDCKAAGIHSTLAEVFASKQAVATVDSLDAENALESAETA